MNIGIQSAGTDVKFRKISPVHVIAITGLMPRCLSYVRLPETAGSRQCYPHCSTFESVVTASTGCKVPTAH